MGKIRKNAGWGVLLADGRGQKRQTVTNTLKKIVAHVGVGGRRTAKSKF